MRLILEANAAGRVTYRKCHVLAPNTAYPVQEVRLDYADLAALHAAILHPGLRGWCEKMMTMFPEAAPPEPVTEDQRRDDDGV